MEKVDVVINVYGKPWQTLCTLKSLIKESGKHIDKIYYICESNQPYNADIKSLTKEFNNIIIYTPISYKFTKSSLGFDVNNENERFEFRYQYGIENSDKKYVFITHNDILYTGDIIGNMLINIDNCVGIGLIGQCWNCPAFSSGMCNGEIFNNYKPSYQDVVKLINDYKPARGQQHNSMINTTNPMPLPECRLNEFACLIDRDITMKECYPNGNTPLFGSYDGIDLACAWFRSLVLKGFNFKNYNIDIDSTHLYFANNVAGYQVQLNYDKYINSEKNAEKYYNENYKN